MELSLLTDLFAPLIVSIVSGVTVNWLWGKIESRKSPSDASKQAGAPVGFAHILTFAIMIAVFFFVFIAVREADSMGIDALADSLRWLARLVFAVLVAVSIYYATNIAADTGGWIFSMICLAAFFMSVFTLLVSVFFWVLIGEWCSFSEWKSYVLGGNSFDCSGPPS